MPEDWIRDPESAQRIRERTEKLSTEARYSTSNQPAALLLDYYEYNKHERLTCPHCGWTGHASEASAEHHRELFDVSCPSCEKMLLVVGYPTIEQTKEAAAAGNEAALAEMPRIEQMEARWARAAGLALNPASDLPEIAGSSLKFIWDLEEAAGETCTVIRCGDLVVWRELSYWEDWERFNEVKDIRKQHYSDRFVSLEPTPESEMYLFGDDLSAASKLETT